MLSRLINEFELRLKLSSASPFIVKEGRFKELKGQCGHTAPLPSDIPISRNTDDEIIAAMRPAGLQGNVAQSIVAFSAFKFYLPGASLRGAWRSWLERALRSLETPGQPKTCNPFADEANDPERSCSKALERSAVPPYAGSCPVCRLFGSTVQAGRLDIGDADLVPGSSPNILIRDQVAISRVGGGVQNKFQLYALEDATFEVVLRLRNFELQHLRLLGMIVSEIPRIPIGSGKGKGFGLFSSSYFSGTVRYFGNRPPDNQLRGIGEDPVWGEEFRRSYGITERTPHALPSASDPFWQEENAYRFAHPIQETDFDQLWRAIDLEFASIRPLQARA